MGFIGLRAALIAVGLSAFCCATTDTTGPLIREPLSGSFKAMDGKAVDLSTFKGKQAVLIDVWATWSKPCEETLPFYSKLYTEMKPRGLEVVSINIDRDAATLSSFLRRHPVSFPVLADPNGEAVERYDVRAVPTALLVNASGTVVQRFEGYRSSDGSEMLKRIQALLAAGR
jgi:peroxiredoxin